MQLVSEKGVELYRDLPWRNIDDPYAVLVSEVMLQQTQVSRVKRYWSRWMELFPTVDALAAAAAACELGIQDEVIRSALKEFKPFDHRNVPCGEAYGIRFVDNAKSGNPAKAEAAVRMYRPGELVLIAGGKDAGMDIRSLAEAAAAICTGVAIFGPAGPRYAEGFRKASERDGAVLKEIFTAASLEEAFHAAVKMAASGQTVLLSPGDKWAPKFRSVYEEGELFGQLVEQLKLEERNRTQKI